MPTQPPDKSDMPDNDAVAAARRIATGAQPPIDRFARRFDELRQALHGQDVRFVAERSGAVLESRGEGVEWLHLDLWGRPVWVSHPGYQVFLNDASTPATPLDTAFILYYLFTADGARLEDRWIAFSELPDARFYDQAFQGYTGMELARVYNDDQAAFHKAAGALGGRRLILGDAAYAFQALPRVPVAVVYQQGDEDFRSTYRLLFDASAGHYLPTDACAILGSTLTRRLSHLRRE